MKEDDPLLDRDLEAALGVQQFVAIEVGEQEYILSFNVAPGYDKSSILFSLGILRHSINQKIRQERMADALREARRIQASILPRGKQRVSRASISAAEPSRWRRSAATTSTSSR